MPRTRVIPVLACLLALAACSNPSSATDSNPSASASATESATPTASATPTSTAKVQDSLDGITVKGKQLKKPTVTFKTPFVIDKTRVEVLDQGSGYKASADSTVTVHYYGVDGRTGKSFDESYTAGTPATFSLAQVITGFKTGLTGQRAGSRVLIAMPGSDAYDAAGGSSDAGIEVGDTLVFVVDIIDVSVSQPEGKELTPPAGLPTVTGSAADKPTVTIPSSSAPSSMSATVLIEGTGTKVAKGDTITARYVGYSWKTGKLIDDGFATPTTGALADLIPGWQTGLVGKTVGSRVLLVLPPDDGFPQGSNNPPVEAGDTVVYVVDILFTTATAA
ncbi:MAG: FKBP-type peptidyl-prolyl cis-trans isomerase [Propionicimonas sp.]|uniref:FKBP-type peptidyl-prolyl cis-trans isomerase n=1 Tax=Propionicimonas sp. TaxID=1955623 RepID=UPI003D13654F